MTTWILVAQRSGARFFEHPAPGEGLNLVKTIQHDEGRMQDREIDTDRPGRTADGLRSMRSEETASERVAADFARSLAGMLQEARVEGRFHHLVLVAEPRLLGHLRDALDTPTAAMVIGSLDKDYYPRDQDHLVKALGEFMRV